MASSRDDVASSSRARITPYPTQAERQLAAELERQAATEEERERLRADLVRQETERKNASQRKRALAAKLKGMENKLLKGGAISVSRCVETPSRHRCDSCPSYEVVAGFFSDFELFRAESGPSGRVRERGRGDGVFATARRGDAVHVAVRESTPREGELRQFRECRSSQANCSTRPRRRKRSSGRPSRSSRASKRPREGWRTRCARPCPS